MKIWRMLKVLLLCSSLTWNLGAQGMQFFQGTWEEALAEAKAQEKPLFVDAFTTWCGPCKVMAKNVFTNDEVGAFFNRNFINVQLDMEQAPGLAFGRKYPVSAYPTLYFIDYDGKVLRKAIGAQQAEAFLDLGKKILNSIDRSVALEAQYAAGQRDPAFILSFIKALNQAQKPSARIANDYLREQKDLRTPINLQIIFAAANAADTKAFDWLIEYRTAVEAALTPTAVQQRIWEACRATADKAIRFKTPDLLADAVEKMKRHYPQRAKAFAARMELEQALANENQADIVKAGKNLFKSAASEPALELRQIALAVKKQANKEVNLLKVAMEIAGVAAAKGQTSIYFLSYAELQLACGLSTEAKASAQKALELARKEGVEAEARVMQFIGKLS